MDCKDDVNNEEYELENNLSLEQEIEMEMNGIDFDMPYLIGLE